MKQTAIVTGGSRGIGRAVAVRLAKDGMNLVINYRGNSAAAEETERLCRELGAEVLLVQGDVSCAEDCEKLAAQAKEAFGRVDVLVNNAGIVQSGPLEGISTEEFDAVMATNVRAPFILMRETLPLLKASPSPEIINVCSVVAHEGYPNQSAYVASKHALCGLSKSFANEVFDDGVRVHLISPGGVLTDMVAKVRPEIVGTPMILSEDVADAAEYLLTHRSDAVCDEIRLHRVTKAPF